MSDATTSNAVQALNTHPDGEEQDGAPHDMLSGGYGSSLSGSSGGSLSVGSGDSLSVPKSSTPSAFGAYGGAIKIKRSKQTHDAIADIIKDIPRGIHLTAPEVYRRVREMGLQVSLSTVYRTLNLLQADGNVSTVAGDHGKRYESRDSDHDHDHLICLKCGLTIEFTDDLIRGFGRTVAERKGYEHSSSRFDILGICSECKAKDEDHKISMSITAMENSLAQLMDSIPKIQSAISSLESRKLAKALESMVNTLPGVREAGSELEASIGYLSQRPIPVE